jgi:hypothetical protein
MKTLMTLTALCFLLAASVFGQEWRSFQLTNFPPYGQVWECGTVADSLGNLHHYFRAGLPDGFGGFDRSVLYLRTDLYGHILTDTVRLTTSLRYPEPYFANVVGDGGHAWCVWSGWIPADSTHRGLFLAGRDTQGRELLPQTLLGPGAGEGLQSWVMDATLRPEDNTIHVVMEGAPPGPGFYYRVTTRAETLIWRHPIEGLHYGFGPKIHLGPDGTPWAVFVNDLGTGTADLALVSFGPDTSHVIFRPFGSPQREWYLYDFDIDGDYNFHFMIHHDTASVAYFRLNADLQIVERRTLDNGPDGFGSLRTDSEGNCLFVWDQDPGLYWAFRTASGTWSHPPTLMNANLYASSFSLMLLDTSQFAFTAQCALRTEQFEQLYLYTYGFPPDAVPEAQHSQNKSVELSISPNPFNATTRIGYSLPQTGNVRLEVYDVTGRLAATLVRGRVDAGEHDARFDGNAMASGIYFVRLQAGTSSQVQKIVLMR